MATKKATDNVSKRPRVDKYTLAVLEKFSDWADKAFCGFMDRYDGKIDKGRNPDSIVHLVNALIKDEQPYATWYATKALIVYDGQVCQVFVHFSWGQNSSAAKSVSKRKYSMDKYPFAT